MLSDHGPVCPGLSVKDAWLCRAPAEATDVPMAFALLLGIDVDIGIGC